MARIWADIRIGAGARVRLLVPMPAELPSTLIAGICFIGRDGGPVKTLGGFKKSHHTVPDAANAVTNAFLAKLAAGDLATQAETLFQDVRAGLGYKRKDVALSVASPSATLTAKDFAVEIFYSLEESDPARYAITTTLREVRNIHFAQTQEFSRIFAGRFSEISFELKKGVAVEAVIDAVEALDGEGGLTVDYPSDYRDCVLLVEGVEAQVRCTGSSLEVVFPRGGSPAELMTAFAAVHAAFQISKALAALIR